MQTLRPLVGIFLLSVAIPVATAQGQSQMNRTGPRGTPSKCQITKAPRMDSADHPSQAQAAIPAGIESNCSDGRSSSAVAKTSPEGGQNNSGDNPADPAPSPTAQTSICYFSSGPRAGILGDLTGVPGAVPVPVGSVCSDGAGSNGTAVIPGTNVATSVWSGASRASGFGTGRAGSTICQFVSGPKAHGWHDYAPLPPAPIGSSCQDGMSSAGIVVASGHGQQY
jgi:hypothetical protein